VTVPNSVVPREAKQRCCVIPQAQRTAADGSTEFGTHSLRGILAALSPR